MHANLLSDILLLLAAAVLAVAIFRRMRLPPILGYMAVGALIGPSGLGWLADAGEIRFLAELGVMFLMFMLGLEFSWPVLWAARGAVFGLGGAQVLLTGALGAGAAWALGLPADVSVVLGGAFAMSSTAILLKQLADQGELNTRHGRMAISVLLFQDLATLPLLVALPVLSAHGEGLLATLAWSLATATLVFSGLIVAGRWLTSPMIQWAAHSRSAELFVLTSLLIILGAAGIADLAGLSIPLGAFLAGMVIGETPFKHQVHSDIRPFQDVLLGLFFITVGMHIDVAVMAAHWPAVLGITASILLTKPLVLLLIGWAAGTNIAVALRAGITLGHVGEFGLLLVVLAMRWELLALEIGQIVLSAMVLSMAVAPLLVRWNYRAVYGLDLFGYRRNLQRQERRVARVSEGLSDHVVLCGYGSVGQSLARFLDLEGLPYVALELDAERVMRAKSAGEPVLYGDAGRYSLLEAAGIARARAIVITFPDLSMALKIVQQVRRHRSELPILVRTMDLADLDPLREAGATEVFAEALEASVVMGAQLLLLMGVATDSVEEHMETIRAREYHLLRGYFQGEAARRTRPPVPEVETVRLPHEAAAVGNDVGSLALQSSGVALLAIRREGIKLPAPPDQTILRAGDVLVLSGLPEQLERARRRVLHGT